MIVGYNFDAVLPKLDENELKLQKLKKGPIIYCKMYKFIPKNFALVVHYSKEVSTNKNEQDCS